MDAPAADAIAGAQPAPVPAAGHGALAAARRRTCSPGPAATAPAATCCPRERARRCSPCCPRCRSRSPARSPTTRRPGRRWCSSSRPPAGCWRWPSTPRWTPGLRGLPVKAVFPAASIFKLVTASALLDAGLTPEEETCYHGGKRRISERLLEDTASDRQCLSLSEALGRSANGVFAKLTHRHLTAEKLLAAAELFHFNRPLPFPVPVEPSLAYVPDDALGLAQTGAGFGDVFLSPLHGALIAAVAANGGLWRPPVLFERDLADRRRGGAGPQPRARRRAHPR